MSKSLWSICFLILSLIAGITPSIAQQPGIQPRGAQPAVAAVAPAAPQAPKEPFTLSPQEQQRMNQLLADWEAESNKVKLFRCKFTRWDYDRTFGPKKNEFLMSERHGIIKFRAPDKGTFKEEEMKIYDGNADKYVESQVDLDYWVCDGNAVYQFKPKQKILEVTQLPPAMRGKAITEGPLPFIFGAKAKTLKERYWIRETTPQEQQGKQLWLEAYPKFREQAANFHHVEVILGAQDLLPIGMEVTMPNERDRTSYIFEDRKINDRIADFIAADFMPPMTPFGWKKVVNPADPPAAEAAPANPQRQATAPPANTLR